MNIFASVLHGISVKMSPGLGSKTFKYFFDSFNWTKFFLWKWCLCKRLQWKNERQQWTLHAQIKQEFFTHRYRFVTYFILNFLNLLLPLLFCILLSFTLLQQVNVNSVMVRTHFVWIIITVLRSWNLRGLVFLSHRVTSKAVMVTIGLKPLICIYCHTYQ